MSDISWCPLAGEKIAISYCSTIFDQAVDWTDATAGFVFDIFNPTKHVSVLNTSSSLTSISYNPREYMAIAAGAYNGQVGFWDVRTPGDPQGMISLTESHTEPVYSAIWTSSKTNTEIMTTSADGTVRWWDTRMFRTSHCLVDLHTINKRNKGYLSISPSILEYESTIPSRYMVGTEQGKNVT